MPNDTRPELNVVEIPAEHKLFPEAISSNFGDFVRKAVDFYHRHPEIEGMIRKDQRAAALAARHKRARQRNDQMIRTLELFDDLADLDLRACSTELGTGRPRMHPLLVFVFLLLRGRFGGPCGAIFRDFVLESRSLEAALNPFAHQMPAPTTILENLNIVSDKTLCSIHQLQLAWALKQGLDNFERIAIDSTAVQASSAWPTDSKTVVDLCARFLRTEDKLKPFGLVPPSKVKCEDWLNQMIIQHKAISMSGKGAKASDKRTKHYGEFFEVACKLIRRLGERHSAHQSGLDQVKLPPLAADRLRLLVQLLGEDFSAALTTLVHCIARVEKGCTPQARKRILGVADRAAAIIVKGSREPLIGYKPQLARSASGLVTAVIVESGNPADSANLVPLTRASFEATCVLPKAISADDGYASKAGLEELRKLGVQRVSISGAKGKKLLDKEWNTPEMIELRSWRSSVESLMFVLKHGYGFARLGRRGLDVVRRELLEKILAYNLDRLILLRKREQAAQPLAIAA